MATAIIKASLTGDSSQFTASMNQAMRSVVELRQAAGSVSSTLGSMLSVAGVIAFGKEMLQESSHVYDLAHSLGVSTDEMQRLGFTARQMGSEQETLVRALLKVQTVIATGGEEGKRYERALADLGMTEKDILNVPVDEMLLKLADGFTKASDRATANGAAMTLFGQRLYTVLPILEQGRAGINQMFDEAPVKMESTIKQAKLLTMQFDALWEAIKKGGTSAATHTAGGVIETGGYLRASLQYLASYFEGIDAKEARDTFQEQINQIGVLAGTLKLSEKNADALREKLAALRASGRGNSDEAGTIVNTLGLFKEPLVKPARSGGDPEFDSQKQVSLENEINRILKEREDLLARSAAAQASETENLQTYLDRIEELKSALTQGPGGGGPVVVDSKEIAENLKEQAALQEKVAETRKRIAAEEAQTGERLARNQEEIEQKNFEAGLTAMSREEKIAALKQRQSEIVEDAAQRESGGTDKDKEIASGWRKTAAEIGLEITRLENRPAELRASNEIYRAPISTIGASSPAVFAQVTDKLVPELKAHRAHLSKIQTNTAGTKTAVEGVRTALHNG